MMHAITEKTGEASEWEGEGEDRISYVIRATGSWLGSVMTEFDMLSEAVTLGWGGRARNLIYYPGSEERRDGLGDEMEFDMERRYPRLSTKETMVKIADEWEDLRTAGKGGLVEPRSQVQTFKREEHNRFNNDWSSPVHGSSCSTNRSDIRGCGCTGRKA
ncbi:hypothetical protein BJV78DRAFT_137483 [Lactifluus subvellereus]|nr:hypothetical protein BJV78DRAFT_137483 [Lactifluus subvellereus]